MSPALPILAPRALRTKGSHYEIWEHNFVVSVCACEEMSKCVVCAFVCVCVDDTSEAESMHVCTSLCVVSISHVWVMCACTWLCICVVFSLQPIIQLVFVKYLFLYLVNNYFVLL